MSAAREDFDCEARVLCKGYRDRVVAWLGPDGKLEYTKLRSDVFELPRVPEEVAFGIGYGDNIEDLVANLEAATGMEATRVATWEALPYKGSYGPFPASVGIALVER